MIVLIALWVQWPWPPRIIALSAFLLSWPHIAWVLGTRYFPTLRGAQWIILSDSIFFLALWPILEWSIVPIYFAMTALFVNSTSCGGTRLFVNNCAIIIAALIMIFVFIGIPKSIIMPPPHVSVLHFFFTSIYCGFVGFAAHKTGSSLTRSRAQLRELTEQLEQRVASRTAELRSANEAFLRFVPAEFLHALGYHDITKARLGDATSQMVTILFSDIRNFTKLSEQMTPTQAFAFLNSCLSRVGPHVRVNGGFIDKYIGDAIMALFPTDPAAAVRAGIAMSKEVLSYNSKNSERSSIAIGIGIHTGQVMMGTIGEEQRFEVTVISDSVNLAARLESLTKQFGTTMIISQEVAAYLNNEELETTRKLGKFIVKGKSSPVEIIEIFTADNEPLREHKLVTRGQFYGAIDAYRRNDIKAAIAGLRALCSLNKDDGPARWWYDFIVNKTDYPHDSLASREAILLDAK